jgi:hypothetical protein
MNCGSETLSHQILENRITVHDWLAFATKFCIGIACKHSLVKITAYSYPKKIKKDTKAS